MSYGPVNAHIRTGQRYTGHSIKNCDANRWVKFESWEQLSSKSRKYIRSTG